MGFSREAFLYGVALVYMIAFASLYVQIPGLYGDSGVLPVRNVLRHSTPQGYKDFAQQPTLLNFKDRYGLDTESAMDFLCLLGILLSFTATVSAEMRTSLVFSLLWLLYLSLYSVGQTFLGFQWDILLLETGFLAVVVAPLGLFRMPKSHYHDKVTMWLVKWLLFRLMFASGTVKLKSGCETWWGLTALDWHFESQCIPTPLAWYFHHLPQWFRMMSNSVVFIKQIAVSFLFFSPIRNLRLFAFYTHVLLQVLILLTGNYNFFNLLSIVLCFSLLDDDDDTKKARPVEVTRRGGILSRISSFISLLLSLLVYVILAVCSLKYFSFTFSDFKINSRINFTRQQFDSFTYYALGTSIWIGILSLGWEIAGALMRSVFVQKGVTGKAYSVISTAIMSLAAVFLFSISLVPHTVVDRSVQSELPYTIFRWHQQASPLHLTHSYGLFRRMTGVGGRPEIVLLGSNDKENWREYEFIYKPGNVTTAPPVVAPHQPRLDWQMWFAALSSYGSDNWFIIMTYRLLSHEPTVIDLLHHNPFPDSPPKYMKALRYTYHYSPATAEKDWWRRDEKPFQYMAPVTKEDFIGYFKKNNMKMFLKRNVAVSRLDSGLRYLRSLLSGVDHVLFVNGLAALALVNLLIRRISRK